ncbi:hypothetical protein CAC42_1869 [Sphaceloma murrayae]|uniref:Fork-head transcriptional regulator 2 n=1 Tax=Sphaceloma murrayae TaxID=2082308 RepID=A0A2K1QW58_9PEZI|nr:hypothetical protein CAC42_1869 [Sphaceloma murrayae]
MATTASNAPAAFGVLQTPSFPQHSPYMTDALVKSEFDLSDDNPHALPSSPLNVFNNPYESDTVAQQEEIAPAPAPSQSGVQEMMGNLRKRSESANIHPQGDMDMYSQDVSVIDDSIKAELDSYAAEEPAAVEPQPMQAYAKLQFDDGDFFVNTFAVELGRDQEALRRHKRHRKRAKKRRAMEEGEDGAMMELGDDVSYSARLKLGNALGMAGSNVSEGGIIGVSVYSDSEGEARQARRRRRRGIASQDSSHSQSIAPANILHNPNISLTDDVFAEDGQSLMPPPVDCPFIPIYRPSATGHNNISRKHIRIEYNSERAYWEMHVLGRNGVFLDGNLVDKGETVKLDHGSHIQVQMMNITFKLPDVAITDEHMPNESAESGSEVEMLESSPEDPGTARLASGTPSEVEEEMPRERPKLKLSLSKRGQTLDKKTAKAAKISLKPAKKEKEASVDEDEPAPEEIRKSIEQVPEPKAKPEVPGVPATPAANLAPGSVLEGLAPEEIPQKRKGPGRPPKNGVMSKRDEAIIKRKKKELQKAGLEIPPLAELLAMARAESGTVTKKPGEEDGEGVVISTATSGERTSAASGEGSIKPQTAADIEAAKARKMAAKSPSPQKPESEYTEEELKKPQKTYVVLIHDALSNSPTGIMDLQQIYDAIQKMYPYYKYRSQTQGWQSSIRHNLIGSEAFEEAGKIGKGRLWKINPNYNIDKEKKRRQPTPPISDSKPAYQYPYPQGQGQYSNQGYPPYRPSPYGTPYGPPTTALPNGAKPPPSYAAQRNGTYYSPYASQPQNGQPHQSPYGAQTRPPYPPAHAPGQAYNSQSPAAGTPPTGSQRPNAPPSAQPTSGSQPPAAGAPSQPGQARPPQQQEGIGNNDTIEEIMAYHKKYLGQFRPGPDQDAARDLFRKAVSRHIDQNKVHGAYISDEEKKVADVIGEIITRNKGKPRPVVQAAPGQSPAGQSQAQPQGQPAVQAQAQVPPGQARPPQPASPQVSSVPSAAGPASTQQRTPAAAAPPPAQMQAPGPPPRQAQSSHPSSAAPTTIDLTDSQDTRAAVPSAPAMSTQTCPPGAPKVPTPPTVSAMAPSTGPAPAAAAPSQTDAKPAPGMKRSADGEGEDPESKRVKM